MTTVQTVGAVSSDAAEWFAIDWQAVNRNVRRLLVRIVQAWKAGRDSAVTRFTAYISPSPNRVFLKKAFEGLEPDVPKGSSPVLRGLGPSNGVRLLGPTVTFRVLFVFVVLSHARRKVVHFGVAECPTQEWTMQQLREAFPWDQAPRYVLRDRDAIYGRNFVAMTRDMRMEEVLTAPRSPWQNPFAERLVGSIRRECLDHVLVRNSRSLRRTLQRYFAYYASCRTHLSLAKDAPLRRPVQPPALGKVIEIPQVGGLHHLYIRKAA